MGLMMVLSWSSSVLSASLSSSVTLLSSPSKDETECGVWPGRGDGAGEGKAGATWVTVKRGDMAKSAAGRGDVGARKSDGSWPMLVLKRGDGAEASVLWKTAVMRFSVCDLDSDSSLACLALIISGFRDGGSLGAMLGWPPRRSPWCIDDGCSGIVICWYVLL